MYLTLPYVVLAAAFFGIGTGQLAPAKRQVNSNFCNTVRQSVRAASQGPSATTYCSSYLKIPASTATSTTGTTTLTIGRTITISTRTTVTTGNAGTTTVTTTVSDGISTVTGSTCDGQNQKRQASPTVPRPSALRAYASGPTLSSACKCLSVPTSTTTVSVAATAFANPRTTITSTRTVQGTTSVTETNTVTVPSGTTSTNIPAASCTPILKDPSFEACPQSSIDTYNSYYNYWSVAGAVKFQTEASDGFSSPYGSTHVHLYGNEQRTSQLTQSYTNVGDMVQGQTYGLSFAIKITKNNGITSSTNCYLNAGFNTAEIWHRDFTSADGPGDWTTVTTQFQYPYDGGSQFDIRLNCPYSAFEVLFDNVQITSASS